jgi:hypothetical protein
MLIIYYLLFFKLIYYLIIKTSFIINSELSCMNMYYFFIIKIYIPFFKIN